MKRLIISIAVYAVCCFGSYSVWAEQERGVLKLAQTDRILIVAPHPDDEVIGTGGVIQEAVSLNIPVRVLYLTNGDSNSLAFFYYKKRPVLGGRQAIKMGELRQSESALAMRSLGMGSDELTFLGYPDYGTLNIFKYYWNSARTYRSVLTRVDHNPYSRSLSPKAQYHAGNILADFKKVIEGFQPTKIFVTHPADNNADHQAAFLFLKVALWDLNLGPDKVSVLTYLVHASNWPRPLGLYPQRTLDPPKHLKVPYCRWLDFILSSKQVEGKKNAFGFFKTQIPYKPKFLFTFVGKNELFAFNREVKLKESPLTRNDWSVKEEAQTAMIDHHLLKPARIRMFRSVVFALDEGKLYLRVRLNQRSLKDIDFDIYLFGYRQDIPFGAMPKIHLKMNKDLAVDAYDGRKYVRSSKVRVNRVGNDIFIAVPLELLNKPHKLFGSVHVRIEHLPLESSAWEIMEMEYGS